MPKIVIVAVIIGLIAVTGVLVWLIVGGGANGPEQPGEQNPTYPLEPPQIILSYQGQEYQGVQGSYCWPAEEGVNPLCADTVFPNPQESIQVAAGDTVDVAIQNIEVAPIELGIGLFTSPEDATPTLVEVVSGLQSSFAPNAPPGEYIVIVSARWDVGDIYYGFKINVQ